jgi:hypothetical protein
MRTVALFCLASAIACPSVASAEVMPFHLAPQAGAMPAPTFALQYEVKLHVGDRATMATDLIGAGVADKDAAMVAKLAGERFADAERSCFVRLALSEGGEGQVRLDRVTLYVGEKQVVIERRDGVLSVTSDRVVDRFRTLV